MPETTERDLSQADARGALQKRRLLLLAVLLIGVMGGAAAVISTSRGSSEKPAPPQPQFNIAAAGSTGEAELVLPPADGDYSKFLHTNPNHARFTCLLCHRREGNSPQIKRPNHTPCSGCHAQQFADASSGICTVCHTGLGAGKPEVKPFPRLKTFTVKFDHARHNQIDCSKCHRPENRGVALSIPAGFEAHATCFECHSARAQAGGRDISSCGTCHKPGSYVRTPELARAFKANFSHAKHAREGVSCSACHTVQVGMPQGKQVTLPTVSMHRGAQGCMICHNNRRAFGDKDFADCKKCHQGPTFRF
ncbi:MAG TPA: cytochrome c3 family protein [Blastocatellia bacterium]|nr:cytochrome c3 family protein [Blastocatellia bacterium]